MKNATLLACSLLLGMAAFAQSNKPLPQFLTTDGTVYAIQRYGNTTITRDSSGTLTSSSTIGNQWYKDGSPISGATAQTYKPETPGSYSVRVSINDCHSVVSDPFNLCTPSPPTPTSSTTSFNYCVGDASTTLSATPAAGSTLLWYDTPMGGTGSTVAPKPGTASVGTFNFYATSSSNGCESLTRLAFTVNVKPLPDANMNSGSNTYFCQYDPAALIEFIGTNATAPYTFTYKIDQGNQTTIKSDSTNSASISLSTASLVQYKIELIKVESANGCNRSLSKTLYVAIKGTPKPTISQDNTGNLVCSESAWFYYWYKDGIAISGANEKIYKPTATGKYTVIVTYDLRCFSQPSDPFNYVPTSLVKLGEGQYLRIWPNPANTNIRIEFSIQGTTQLQAKVHDLKGRLVGKMNRVANGENIPIKHLNSGNYLLLIFDVKGRLLHREQVVFQ